MTQHFAFTLPRAAQGHMWAEVFAAMVERELSPIMNYDDAKRSQDETELSALVGLDFKQVPTEGAARFVALHAASDDFAMRAESDASLDASLDRVDELVFRLSFGAIVARFKGEAVGFETHTIAQGNVLICSGAEDASVNNAAEFASAYLAAFAPDQTVEFGWAEITDDALEALGRQNPDAIVAAAVGALGGGVVRVTANTASGS